MALFAFFKLNVLIILSDSFAPLPLLNSAHVATIMSLFIYFDF